MEEYNWADFGSPAADNQVSYYLRDYFSLGELTKAKIYNIYFALAANLVSIS